MYSSLDLETQYCAHNYHPLPVVLARGEGVFVGVVDDVDQVPLAS